MAENKTTEVGPKKTLLDMNASWALLVLYLVYLAGMFALQNYYIYPNAVKSGLPVNSILFVFMALIFGILGSFFFYNMGKIIFAKMVGYHVAYVRLFGFLIDKTSGKSKTTFNIISLFDLSLQFAPDGDDLKKNPRRIFIGGFLFELIPVAIELVLFFLFSFGNQASSVTNAVGWSALFCLIYGLIVPLYEVMPFRQDYPTDMYNLLQTRTDEDKVAYNIVHVNRANELSGKDFVAPSFETYDSYYKAQTVYALYLNDLYQNNLEKAVSDLDVMKANGIYLPEEEQYIPSAELIFLRYLIDDLDGADKKFLTLKNDDKKAITSPTHLAGYRTALFILGNISVDKDAIDSLLKDFAKKIPEEGKPVSARVAKEKEFFHQAYEKLKVAKPTLGLK
jgi:hypothetical protein